MALKRIIEGCQNKERKFQEKLYELYYKKLMLICYRYAPTKDDANDILQESFIRIFNKIDTFDLSKGEEKLTPWLSRVTINVALKYIKEFYKVDFDSDNSSVDSAVSLDNTTSNDWSMSDLLKCIECLPTRQRIVFNLYAIDGYNHIEIGELIKITESASRAQLSKARTKLKGILKSQEISGVEYIR